MLTPKLESALNDQLNLEIEAAYLYFAMSSFAASRSLDGFGHWLFLQAQEELNHGMRIYRYLQDRDAKIEFRAVSAPKADYSSFEDVFVTALGNEEKLAEKLNELSTLSIQENDNASHTFLEWFNTEQVEEIASCKNILDKIRLIGDDGHGLLILDGELGKRAPEKEE